MPRTTGHTYEMMLKALRTASNGKTVIVVANRLEYARELALRVQTAADALGADMKRIKVLAATEESLTDMMRGRNGAVVFTDNSVWS